MPRWANTASPLVGSATMTASYVRGSRRKPAMQRASLASSSVENSKASGPSLALATANNAAAAPLMSQAPRPTARSAVTRKTCGSALRAGPKVGDRHRETPQLRAQIVEDAAGVDRARRVARVETDQRLQVLQRGIEQCAHPRLTSAHSVLLMPNSLMKPSASSTPQSADCA